MNAVNADTPVAARFREVAASMPDTLAMVSARARVTYEELDRWSDAIAADLVAAAPPTDVPIAIVMREHVSLVPAALGAVKAGRFFVILDATDPAERIASILATTGATLAVVDDARFQHAGLRVLPMRPLPDAPVERIECPPHELVQLVFTSGTTGAPKAVASRQRSFVERLVGASARTGRAMGERVSYTAMPGHARAAGEIFGSLLNGATLCPFDARHESLATLAEIIERERISILTLTPALFRRFMRTLPASADLSSVRKLRIGADVITLADVDAWRNRFPRTTTLERAFNSTETGMVLHISITHDMSIPGPLVPLGRPLPGVEVRVLDEHRKEVRDGETGELVVRGPHVAHGYWNAPELTAEKFTFDAQHGDAPTFRTGDLVRRDANGLYYFVGRRDARLKIHGRRIDPVEVESALVQHGGAVEAVAVAAPAADGELQLVAYVVVARGLFFSATEIRAAMRGKVPAWMIPSRIHLLDSLPMTSSGKVDRDALSQRAATPEPTPAHADAAADNFEQTLLAIWSRVLGTDVHLDDDFFDDLGGTSLAAAELIAEIKRVTGRLMPLSVVLELNTVRKMADYLTARPDMERTLIAVHPAGSLPPLFAVSGKGGGVIFFRQLAALLGADQPFYGLSPHGIAPANFPKSLAAIAACYVDAVRAKQPSGPYYLAGYSAGGFVAFEMARQLTRAGETVAFVGLFDTVASRERASRLKRYRKWVEIFRRKPAASAMRYLRAFGRRFVWLARWLRSGGRSSFRPKNPAEMVATMRLFESLQMQSALQPYPGRVTLFLARQGRGADCADPDGGWTPLCGALDVIEIDGEHHSILRQDTECLAAPLARELAKARASIAAAVPPVPVERQALSLPGNQRSAG